MEDQKRTEKYFIEKKIKKKKYQFCKMILEKILITMKYYSVMKVK